MYIQMLFLAPPPTPPHKRYILPVSVNLPLLTTLGAICFQHTFILSLHVLISKSLNYTTPFSTLLPNVFTSHTRHCTPCRALSLPLPPSLARYMHCLSSPPTSRAHARCISRSLPRDCLTLSSTRRATLAQSRSLYLSLV